MGSRGCARRWVSTYLLWHWLPCHWRGKLGIESTYARSLTSSEGPVPQQQRFLFHESNANALPFLVAIGNAGIDGLSHVINAAILTSAWSADSTFLFSGSRILYSPALSAQAPHLFDRTNKRGVPYAAVMLTWLPGLLAYLKSQIRLPRSSTGSSISPLSPGTWPGMLSNHLHPLPESTRLLSSSRNVITQEITLTICDVGGTYCFQHSDVGQRLPKTFSPDVWSVSGFLAAYNTTPIFLALYLGLKILRRTSFAMLVREIYVVSAKWEMDAYCAMDEEPVPKNIWQKIWVWIVRGLSKVCANIFSLCGSLTMYSAHKGGRLSSMFHMGGRHVLSAMI